MYEFKVQGMTCRSCASAMKKSIMTLDPNVDLEVNLVTQTVKVKTVKTQSEVAVLIEEAGFPVLQATRIE